MPSSMTLAVLLFGAFAAGGPVCLLTARLLYARPFGRVVWIPVSGWFAGYIAGCVTGYVIWRIWPRVMGAFVGEPVAFAALAIVTAMLGAAVGWVLVKAYRRPHADGHEGEVGRQPTTSPGGTTDPLYPANDTPGRRMALAVALAVALLVLLAGCVGGVRFVWWLIRDVAAAA